jgi:hypothetical protein
MPEPAAPPTLTARTEADRAEAHRRWLILRAHLEDGVALSQVAADTGIRHRTCSGGWPATATPDWRAWPVPRGQTRAVPAFPNH